MATETTLAYKYQNQDRSIDVFIPSHSVIYRVEKTANSKVDYTNIKKAMFAKEPNNYYMHCQFKSRVKAILIKLDGSKTKDVTVPIGHLYKSELEEIEIPLNIADKAKDIATKTLNVQVGETQTTIAYAYRKFSYSDPSSVDPETYIETFIPSYKIIIKSKGDPIFADKAENTFVVKIAKRCLLQNKVNDPPEYTECMITSELYEVQIHLKTVEKAVAIAKLKLELEKLNKEFSSEIGDCHLLASFEWKD